MLINFVKEHPDAKLPKFADDGCTGADLYSVERVALRGMKVNYYIDPDPTKSFINGCTWPSMAKIDTGLSIGNIVCSPYYKAENARLLDQLDIQIRMRSGLASKGLILLNGVGTIDHTYRGPIKVLVANLGEEELVIEKGDRIAQLVIGLRYPQDEVKFEVISKEQQEQTDRGSGGFGSTGR